MAPIKFTVAHSDREAELLKAKFDRFLKLCQEECGERPADLQLRAILRSRARGGAALGGGNGVVRQCGVA